MQEINSERNVNTTYLCEYLHNVGNAERYIQILFFLIDLLKRAHVFLLDAVASAFSFYVQVSFIHIYGKALLPHW